MDSIYTDLIKELNELKNTDKVLLSVLTTVHAEQVERIFDKGLDADEQPIGEYSTKPISVSKKNQVRKTRSTYFAGGYKQYKQEIGFDGKVNLVLTGQMRSDYSVVKVEDNIYGLGFKNDFNSDKADWNEANFQKEIFAVSPTEDKILDDAFEVELKRIFG